MYSRINYTLVGLFVMLFMAGIFIFGFWLAKYGFEEKYDYYRMYFSESVDGLSVDSSVKLNGVEVGKVNAIEIDRKNPERIRVTVRLKAGTPVTADMLATLKLEGVTGLSLIDILGGHKNAPRLNTSEGEMPVIRTRKSFMGELTRATPNLLKKLENIVENFEKLLSEQNRKYVTEILLNSSTASEKAVNLEKKLENLSDEFNLTLHRINSRIDPLLKHFDKAGINIARLSKSLNQRINKGEFDLKAIVRPIQVDLRELSYRYQELAEDIKTLTRNPSSLIFGSTKPKKGPGE